jgi:hypothetical protein
LDEALRRGVIYVAVNPHLHIMEARTSEAIDISSTVNEQTSNVAPTLRVLLLGPSLDILGDQGVQLVRPWVPLTVGDWTRYMSAPPPSG